MGARPALPVTPGIDVTSAHAEAVPARLSRGVSLAEQRLLREQRLLGEQRLLEVAHQICSVFDADCHAHQRGIDADLR